MKQAIFALLSLVITGSLSFAETEFKGQMTEDMCGRSHMMEGVSAAECAHRCVDAGAKYALFVPDDEKMYVIDDQNKAKEFAGENVLVTGTVSEDGKTILLSSIAKQ